MVSRAEDDAARHTEDFRIDPSPAIPRFEVIIAVVSGQKRNQMFQLRTLFYPEVRKLTLKIGRH
jgi:hypothetical protein